MLYYERGLLIDVFGIPADRVAGESNAALLNYGASLQKLRVASPCLTGSSRRLILERKPPLERLVDHNYRKQV